MKEKTKKKLKIVSGVMLVGGVGYLGLRCKKLTDDNKKLTNRLTLLEEIVSEEVLESAITSTTNKLNYRLNKIELYKNKKGPEAETKLQEHMIFKNIFEKRLADFNELKRLRYIEK